MLSTSSIFVHVGLKGISQMPFMLSERVFFVKNGSLENCLQIQSSMVMRIHAIYSHTYSLVLEILYREKCSTLIWDKNYCNRCCIQGSEVAIQKWKMRSDSPEIHFASFEFTLKKPSKTNTWRSITFHLERNHLI